jgi:hypothetical protein
VENNIWFPFLEQREKQKKKTHSWTVQSEQQKEMLFQLSIAKLKGEMGKIKRKPNSPCFRCATLILLAKKSYKGI